MISVSIRGVCVAYGSAKVVNELSTDVAAGSWLTFIGPNGAGKTTALRAIAGLVGFTGNVGLGADSVHATSRRKLARLVAYVPQRPIIPEGATVTDYVLMGRNPYIGYLGSESGSDIAVVANVLERLDLRRFAQRQVASLSGGEIQRAVLARALAQQAPVLLLDEPTSALDIGHQQQVLELVDNLRVEQGLTVVSAMHDLTLAGQYSQEFVLLDQGRSVAQGPPHEVLREDLISRYYGASVQVTSNGSGVFVIPKRASRKVGV